MKLETLFFISATRRVSVYRTHDINLINCFSWYEFVHSLLMYTAGSIDIKF